MTVEIDCDAKLHLCQAACCRLRFQPHDDDIVERDPVDPAWNAHDDDGWCHHLRRDGPPTEPGFGGCTVYERRPRPCRSFDCRNDTRIWRDFEAGIVSDHLAFFLAHPAGPGESITVDLTKKPPGPPAGRR